MKKYGFFLAVKMRFLWCSVKKKVILAHNEYNVNKPCGKFRRSTGEELSAQWAM